MLEICASFPEESEGGPNMTAVYAIPLQAQQPATSHPRPPPLEDSAAKAAEKYLFELGQSVRSAQAVRSAQPVRSAQAVRSAPAAPPPQPVPPGVRIVWI